MKHDRIVIITGLLVGWVHSLSIAFSPMAI